MIRLAITLSEPRYRALKKAASLRGRTSGQLIDKSLDFYGVNSREEAIELVRRARASRGWMKFKPCRLRLARFIRHVALTSRDDLTNGDRRQVVAASRAAATTRQDAAGFCGASAGFRRYDVLIT